MATHRILVSATDVPNGITNIIRSLPAKEKFAAGDDVVLQFDDNFVFLTGLVLLAAWRKSFPAGISFHVDDSRSSFVKQSLLTNSGFREIVNTGHESPSVPLRSGRFPLRPIANRFSKDATVHGVVSIFEDNAGQVTDLAPFKVLLSEITENALTHSEFASPAYVAARVIEMKGRRVAEIVLCDTGIGFRTSYMQGTNAAAKERIKKGANPINIALEGLNSSKPVASTTNAIGYYGYGLFLTRRLVEENRGQLTVVSHGDGYHISNRTVQNLDLHGADFPGTFVSLVLDLDNPLPLDEIYVETTEATVGTMSPPLPATQAPRELAASTNPSNVPIVTPQPSNVFGGGFGSPAITHGTARPTDGGPQGQSEWTLLEIRNFGTDLLTRETGLAIRAEIATLLASGKRVRVSLEGVTDITPSVADEAFAKLAQRLGGESFASKVQFDGGTNLAQRLIGFVMKNRLGA